MQQVVIGLPFSELYADYFKEVRSREVNNKIEHRIILRPKSRKRYTEITMRIVDGLPLEFRKTTDEGQVIVNRMIFEKRGEKYLLNSVKFEERNRLVGQDVFHYVKQGEFHLLSSLDRFIDSRQAERLGRPAKQVMLIERMRINQDLSDDYFGVRRSEPEPKTDESEDSK